MSCDFCINDATATALVTKTFPAKENSMRVCGNCRKIVIEFCERVDLKYEFIDVYCFTCEKTNCSNLDKEEYCCYCSDNLLLDWCDNCRDEGT